MNANLTTEKQVQYIRDLLSKTVSSRYAFINDFVYFIRIPHFSADASKMIDILKQHGSHAETLYKAIIRDHDDNLFGLADEVRRHMSIIRTWRMWSKGDEKEISDEKARQGLALILHDFMLDASANDRKDPGYENKPAFWMRDFHSLEA
jgi:hypothetical protein